MADPLMQAICCQRPDAHSEFHHLMIEIDSMPYNVVCFLSSAVGIFGAVYQILPRTDPDMSHHWYWVTASRGREIIIWLAFADLLASLGVFLRSFMRLMTPVMIQNLRNNNLECVMFAFWIQYFYTVSWFWTLIYAVDMYVAMHKKPAYKKMYHFTSWIIPMIFTFTGLFILYYGYTGCFVSAERDFWHFLPNYVLSYVPMLTVMIINPILYTLSAHSIHVAVVKCFSQYTKKERQVVDAIRIKFGLINVAFYACWLPNLINTVFIYVLWDQLPKETIVSMWYLMAILNPLQALFNSLVYRRPQDQIKAPWASFTVHSQGYLNERTPLLARRHGSSNNSDDFDHESTRNQY